MTEADFRRELSALVESYDVAHADHVNDDDDEIPAVEAWRMRWESMLLDADRSQCHRALTLLALHVRNQADAP